MGKTQTQVESVRNRLIKNSDGSTFFKFGTAPTQISIPAAQSTQTKECGISDAFSLKNTGPIMIAYDMNYPIFNEIQSNIVSNPTWSDSNQKVHIQVLDTSDVLHGSLASFASAQFSVTLPSLL